MISTSSIIDFLENAQSISSHVFTYISKILNNIGFPHLISYNLCMLVCKATIPDI